LVKCPKCGREVEYLINEAMTEYKAKIVGGSFDYEVIDAVEDGVYKCPYCGEIIAKSEKEALRALGLRA